MCEDRQCMAEGIKLSRTVLGLIATVLLQVAGLLVWGSSLNARVEFIQTQLVEIKESMVAGTRDRYTTGDASRDKELYLQLFKGNADRISKLETEVHALQ